MIRARCYVGRFRSDLRSPGLTNLQLANAIEGSFARGSRSTRSGESRVQMRVQYDRLNTSVTALSRPTNTRNLQMALRQLIGRQPQEPSPRRMGLLFADEYAHRRSLLGIMFDLGIPGQDVPREGCAVFLDAIFAIRANESEAAYKKEVRFTCVHELGHVLNLWHDESSLNYMKSSQGTVYPSTAHRFTPLARRFMITADRSYIKPGDRQFADRPAGYPPHRNTGNRVGNQIRAEQVSFRIAIEKSSFHYFEPVELDVKVSAKRRVTINDCIDPGYSSFIIWIEDPRGERRRYRSVKSFANVPGSITIEPGKPFKRDITVYLESAGYTFHLPGTYRLWVNFIYGNREYRSNTVNLEVLQSVAGKPKFDRLEDALTRRNVLALLYYRNAALTKTDHEAIGYVLRRHSESFVSSRLRFCIGHMYAQRFLNSARPRKSWRLVAVDQLSRACDHHDVSAHRRSRAKELMSEL